MLDEALRRRLEALNRGPLPDPPPAPLAVQSRAAAVKPSRRVGVPRTPLVPRAVKPLPGLLRSGEVVATAAGEHLRIEIPLEELWGRGPDRIADRQRQLVEYRPPIDAELAALVQAFPDQLLLVDLETCGLAGSALFLIGLLRSLRGELVVELLLARNYAEERAVLETFWRIAADCQVLVTFNGKTFDWPMLLDRSQRYLLFRGSRPPELQHVDLLHHARRRWKRELPDCRLQTLEARICNRGRMGDIPGSMIPAAYADYVRTGFERDMEAILYHNAVDLVTLLDLGMRLAGETPT